MVPRAAEFPGTITHFVFQELLQCGSGDPCCFPSILLALFLDTSHIPICNNYSDSVNDINTNIQVFSFVVHNAVYYLSQGCRFQNIHKECM